MKTKIAVVSICVGTLILLASCERPKDTSSSPTNGVPRVSTPDLPAQATNGAPTHSIAAMAVLSPASGSNVRGTVSFIRDGEKVRVEGTFTGLTPGSHGFHLHEKGDCSAADASSAGGHFNPAGKPHAGPDDAERHAGDFGNLEADASGNASYSRTFEGIQLEGDTSIIGKAVIVHAQADDLKSQPSGNAGGRVACGVIEKK